MTDFDINDCPKCGSKCVLQKDNFYYEGDDRYTDYIIVCQSLGDCVMKLKITINDEFYIADNMIIQLWNSIKEEE